MKNNSIDLQSCLETIISLLPGHVYWKDLKGIFMGCNEAQALSAGFVSSKGMIGKTDYEMPWKKEADEIRKNDMIVMETKKEFVKEETSTLSNGKKIVFLSKKVPLLDNNQNVIGVLGVSLDITDRKRAEQELSHTKNALEESNKAQLNLLSLINHESRTPMHVVLGMAQILLNKKPNDFKNKKNCYEVYVDGIKKIYSYGSKLMDVINYIYDFVEQEAYEKELPLDEVDLKKFFQWFPDEYSDRLKERRIILNINYGKNVPEKFLINSRRFFHVLESLINNAIKYTKNGNIDINVTSKKHVKNQNIYYLNISVKDTGCGIRKEHLKHIFDHFDYDRNKTYISSGLTLSADKKRVEMLGGKMCIKSERGNGTEVLLNLPITVTVHNNKQINTKKKPYIFIIEDDEPSAFIIKEMLASIGCDIDVAYTGKEAETILRKNINKYDLVLLDLLLQDMFGYELIPIIKKYTKKRTPILAVTAQVTDSDKEKCLAAGVEDIIYKPVYLSDLRDILNEYIHKK